MAVTEASGRFTYTGNGSTTSFPFPNLFFLDSDLKVIVTTTLTGAESAKVLNTDYTVSGAGNPSGGSVEMAVAPTSLEKIVIYRDPEAIQSLDLIENDQIPAEEVEKAFDKVVLLAQRFLDLMGRSLRLPDGYVGTFDPVFRGTPLAGYVMVINDDEDGIDFTDPAAFVGPPGPQGPEGPQGPGVPPGGATGAALVKASATDEDVEWDDFVYSGISRFGAFSSAGLADTVTKILNITYTAPSVSLGASSVSNSLREKGTAVTATTLTAAITKQSDPIDEVRFYEGASLLATQTSGGGIPNGGNSTYSWTGSFSDNKTFSVQVDDNGATGGPSTVSASVTFSFVYPYYWGVGAAGLTAANVAALTKTVMASDADHSVNLSPNGSQVLYFAYPASYGALTRIDDVNSFNTILDWTLRTENITGLDGNAVSYRIYEFNNVPTAGTYSYRFMR